MLLNIDLPRFDFPVIFDEHVSQYLSASLSFLSRSLIWETNQSLAFGQQEYQMKQHPLFNNFASPTNTAPPSTQALNALSSIYIVEDHEIARENPVEAKHRRLVRSHRNSPLDRELKPNPKIRDELNVRFLRLGYNLSLALDIAC